jgi:hypothetical protein
MDMLTGPEVAQRAKEQLTALTGLKIDTVSALVRSEGGWRVMLEMVELKRIPESSDVLASYRVSMDDDGMMLTYQRIRRYHRDQTIEEEE